MPTPSKYNNTRFDKNVDSCIDSCGRFDDLKCQEWHKKELARHKRRQDIALVLERMLKKRCTHC